LGGGGPDRRRLHDIGKVSAAFQADIKGEGASRDHSTAGAWEAQAGPHGGSAPIQAGGEVLDDAHAAAARFAQPCIERRDGPAVRSFCPAAAAHDPAELPTHVQDPGSLAVLQNPRDHPGDLGFQLVRPAQEMLRQLLSEGSGCGVGLVTL